MFKIDKRVVSNKDHVVGKIVLEKLGVWTRLLETLEYLLKSTYRNSNWQLGWAMFFYDILRSLLGGGAKHSISVSLCWQPI